MLPSNFCLKLVSNRSACILTPQDYFFLLYTKAALLVKLSLTFFFPAWSLKVVVHWALIEALQPHEDKAF